MNSEKVNSLALGPVGKKLQSRIKRTSEVTQKIKFLGDLFFLAIIFFLEF